LFFPDFKANERAFQLFTQVAGRAGRRDKKGRVIIQTFNPLHPVITETSDYDFVSFYQRELGEREKFGYPPFFRMIRITIKHKKPEMAEAAAKFITERLKAKIGNRVIGPSIPGISRIRGFYIQNIIVKMEKSKVIVARIKALILEAKSEISKVSGLKTARINVDVDP